MSILLVLSLIRALLNYTLKFNQKEMKAMMVPLTTMIRLLYTNDARDNNSGNNETF